MNEHIIYKIIDGKGENRRLDKRYVLLGVFVFMMVAVFSFLLTRNMPDSSAADMTQFKAGNIMSDAVMRNYTSMTEAEIQTFLKNKNPCEKTVSSVKNAKAVTPGKDNGVTYNYEYSYGGKTYHYHVENGKFVCLASESFDGESAAHIIYEAAKDYKINPQVLIVLLEKEQGLITDRWPNTNYQYRSATGYGCPDNAACDSKYYGLKNQIRQAAALFNTVLSGGWTNYPLGNNTIRYSPNASCGSSTVYIENLATSALYRYTPYQPNAAAIKAGTGTAACGAYGNRNFYIYFTDWFGSTQKVVLKTASIILPSDAFTFETSTGEYLVPESSKEGAKLILSAKATADERAYKITKTGDYYTITHIKSGLLVSVPKGDVNEENLIISAANNTEAQKWRFTLSGINYVIHSAILDNKIIDVDKSVKLAFYEEKDTQKIVFKDVSDAPIKDGVYVPITTGNKAMDIEDAKTTDGTRVLTWNVTYSNHQQYTFTRNADGYYSIVNMLSGKQVEVANSSIKNGAAIQIYKKDNTCSQKWMIVKNGEGYNILSACSGKAIEVPNDNVSLTLQKMQINDVNNSKGQLWKLYDITAMLEEQKKAEEERKAKALADGEYTIYSSVGKDFVLDISGGAERANNYTNIQIYQSNGTNAQKFKVTYDAKNDIYSITNTVAKRSIDVSGASKNNGANIQVYTINNTCAQLWHMTKNSDGTYTITSSCSDKVLDVTGAFAKNGTNVQLYKSNGTKAQKWTFKKL